MKRLSSVGLIALGLCGLGSSAMSQTPVLQLSILCPPLTPATTYTLISTIVVEDGCECKPGTGLPVNLPGGGGCFSGSCLGSLGNLHPYIANTVVMSQGSNQGNIGVPANSWTVPVTLGSVLPSGYVDITAICPCDGKPMIVGRIRIC